MIVLVAMELQSESSGMLRAAGTQGEHHRLYVGIDRGTSWSSDRHDLLKLLAIEWQH